MTVEIYKYGEGLETGHTENLEIESYNWISYQANLLYFTDGKFGFDGNSDALTTDIHKIQFIASCKTKFKNEILVAFYFGEYSNLLGYVISGLTSEYSAFGGYVIDYNSYLEICELTNEPKLSLMEYYERVREGHCDQNSFIKINGKYLNYAGRKKYTDENKSKL